LCDVGIHINSFNTNINDEVFRNFDVSISDSYINDSEFDNILLEECSGVNISNIESKNRRIRLRGIKNCSFFDINHSNGSLSIYGQNTSVSNPSNLSNNNIKLDNIFISNGRLLFQDIKGVTCGAIYIADSPSEGCNFTRTANITVNSMIIKRSNTRNLLISKGQHIDLNFLNIEAGLSSTRSLEIGGGDANAVSQDIRILDAIYRHSKGTGSNDILLQGGTYAPKRLYIKMAYLDEAVSIPAWQYYLRD
ncbi:MAG: hypothetical protein AAGI07_06185, partial [Bacteroidota bacterium]